MATQTLTQRRTDASAATAVPVAALAGGTPTTPVVLALDLGQRTGWAVRNRDGAIASGVHEFRPGRFEGGGMIWLRFRAWLQEVDETSGGVGVVVFEEVRRHLGTTASHIYGGYLAHLTAWAEANRIPYQGVPVGTIKRHVTGKGNADKQAVIEAVRRLGFRPADDNEADALALLNWAIAQRIGGVR
jgi:crossover junction endodeoxyribonuclease RuvC